MMWILATAVAQQTPTVPEAVNAQSYRPPMDSERTLWADDAGHVLDGGQFKARMFLSYVNRPLVWYPEGDRTREPTPLVSDALQLNALAMYQYDRFRLGVDIPVYLFSAGQVTQDGAGLGDLALDGRVTILDRAETPIGAAVGARVAFPTTTVEAPLGYGGVGADVFGVIDGEVEGLLVTFNGGGRFLPEEELSNIRTNEQLFARLGAGYQIVEDAGVSLDLNANFLLGALDNPGGIPIEGLLGGWGRIDNNFVLRGGVGTGFTPGIGSPIFRSVITLGYEPAEDLDPDMDGLVGDEDQCPLDPEDKDSFEDLDGCPDPDNDQDGIADLDDQCINDPEDPDGYKDEDGCPDLTTQVTVRVQQQNGDLVPNAEVVITSAEIEGFESKGGPESVADLHEAPYVATATAPDYLENTAEFAVPMEDGEDTVTIILQPDVIMGDLNLTVVNEAGEKLEDVIWYLDGGVGPKPINAGVVSVNIPAGDHTLDIRREGYVTDRRTITVPEKAGLDLEVVLKPSQVKVTKEKIDVEGTVFFDTAKATIQARSFPLLDDVAGTLIDNPQLLKIRIEGHTDSRGGADYNRKLSDRRANSVKEYLIGKGVEAERLESIGFGEDKPVDPADNEEAWAKNRRVDFFITERAEEEEE
jgi:outer membrane protein OmpA-like peptidoglycan-associated protein